jgi:hypothetical protein
MKIKDLPHPPNNEQGKILAFKEGYNPNSSSLGSIVFSYPEYFLVVPTVTSIVAVAILKYFSKKDKNND